MDRRRALALAARHAPGRARRRGTARRARPATDRSKARIRSGCCAASAASVMSSRGSTPPERSAALAADEAAMCALRSSWRPASILASLSAVSADSVGGGAGGRDGADVDLSRSGAEPGDHRRARRRWPAGRRIGCARPGSPRPRPSRADRPPRCRVRAAVPRGDRPPAVRRTSRDRRPRSRPGRSAARPTARRGHAWRWSTRGRRRARRPRSPSAAPRAAACSGRQRRTFRCARSPRRRLPRQPR